MCGIAGFIGRVGPDRPTIDAALATMRRRGPDHAASRIIRESDFTVALLHARLSIIDLDPRSHQPFTIGSLTLVFNGEIYNYLEIRKELESLGVVFVTNSDTEVLLRAYAMWGKAAIPRFEGMWAFAIYDAGTKELLLSRDRFVEKPLYLLKRPEGIYFASEVKTIAALSGHRPSVNRIHLLRNLVNGYKSLYKTKDTFFEGVSELDFATIVTIGGDLEPRSSQYWEPAFAPDSSMTFEEAVEGTRHHFKESIRLRLRADVKLAFCLSGGVDSAAIVSTAAKEFGYDVATFSILDSDERYNERDNMMATINDIGCRHELVEIPRRNFIERLRFLVDYHDAPIYTISYYVHAFLSEAIARAGYRVVVSGTAADELFTGYYDHFNLHLYEMRNHPDFATRLSEWEQFTGTIVRNPVLQNPKIYFENRDERRHIYLNNDVFSGFLTKPFHEEFRERTFCESLLRNRMLNELFDEAIPVILHEDDLNSMCYSIENRSPYLDSRLFSFAYSIPPEHLIRDGYAKYPLREAMKGILNEQVRLDRRKKGFNAAFGSLVDLGDKASVEELLEDSPVFELVDREKVRSILAMESLPNSYSKFLFNFVTTKVFLELFS